MEINQLLTNTKDRVTYNAMRKIPNFSLNYVPRLRTICVELTNRCNLNCRMCNVHVQKRPYGAMSLELFKNIIVQSAKIKPDTLHLNFEGESFLHPQIKDFLELSLSSGAKNRQLFSNGMLVKPYLETIARCLTKITFSLDGVGQVNDNIRLGSKYDVIISNIKALREIRDSQNSVLQIGVNLTNYTQSQSEINQFKTELSKVADVVQVSEYRNPENHYTKPGYDMRYGGKRVARKVRYCAFPLNSLVVLWNGDISFCLCAVTTEPPMLPFNATTQSLREIWRSVAWREMRNNSFRLGYPPYQNCVTCEYRTTIR